jgi:signal transduction histidine kinase
LAADETGAISASAAEFAGLRAGHPAADDLRSQVAIPLRDNEKEVLGILILAWRAPHAYQEAEEQLLTAVGRQVGLALHNIQLNQEAEQLAIIAERQRLARELHDSVTQSLYSLTLLTEAARRFAAAGNAERVASSLERLAEISQQVLKEMRLLIYELRPAALERQRLVPILQQRLEAVEGRAGVEASLRTEGTIALPLRVEEGLYRIAIEALNNILKHAQATTVSVRIRVDKGQVELEITDNGAGFDPQRALSVGGMGLLSMRERVEKMHGTLAIRSAPGQGTTIHVQAPLEKREEDR